MACGNTFRLEDTLLAVASRTLLQHPSAVVDAVEVASNSVGISSNTPPTEIAERVVEVALHDKAVAQPLNLAELFTTAELATIENAYRARAGEHGRLSPQGVGDVTEAVVGSALCSRMGYLPVLHPEAKTVRQLSDGVWYDRNTGELVVTEFKTNRSPLRSLAGGQLQGTLAHALESARRTRTWRTSEAEKAAAVDVLDAYAEGKLRAEVITVEVEQGAVKSARINLVDVSMI